MLTATINLIFFLGPAITLSIRSGYLLMGFAISIIGIATIFTRKISIEQIYKIFFSNYAVPSFIIYAAINIALHFIHDYSASTYGMYLPFLLFPFMLIAIKEAKPDVRFFWLGAASGAIFSLIFAAYQVYVLEVSRAGGHTNPIKFGDTAIVLSTVSLIGLIFFQSKSYERLGKFVLVLGGLSGMFASLLSGSKGGWLSIIIVLTILLASITQRYSAKAKVAIILFTIGLFSLVIGFGAKTQVIDRVASGINGAKIWWKTGEVTEYSVSVRFESWKVGLMIGADNMLVGVGDRRSIEKLVDAAESGIGHKSIGEIKNFDNDLIATFAEKGIIGVFSVLMVYACTFFFFRKMRHHESPIIQGASLSGMLLVFLYFEFGLSVAVFPVNAFRQVFTSWSMLFLGIIYAEIAKNNERINAARESGVDINKIQS